MSFLNGLRLLDDLALYYALAGYFVVSFGGRLSWPCMLIPAVCFGLSAWLAGRSRPARAAVLAPMLLCFALPGAPVEKLAFLPAAGYTLVLALAGDYRLDRYQQISRFKMALTLYPVFALLACVWNARAVLAGSLPALAAGLAVNVYLMRVLRRDPETYLQPAYLARSAAPLAALAGVAALFSLDAVAGWWAGALRWAYLAVVVPVLEWFVWLWGLAADWVFYPILQAFKAIGGIDWMRGVMARMQAEMQTAENFGGRISEETGPGNPVWTAVFRAALALAVFTAAVLLFRFLSKREKEDESSIAGSLWQERDLDPEAPPPQGKRSRGAANQIRRTYRRYLRGCAACGRAPNFWDTSRDVLDTAPPETRAAEQALRALYIRARYQGSASAADAAYARRLWQAIRQKQKSQAT